MKYLFIFIAGFSLFSTILLACAAAPIKEWSDAWLYILSGVISASSFVDCISTIIKVQK